MHVPAALMGSAGRKTDLIHEAPFLSFLRCSPVEASCPKGRAAWDIGVVLSFSQGGSAWVGWCPAPHVTPTRGRAVGTGEQSFSSRGRESLYLRWTLPVWAKLTMCIPHSSQECPRCWSMAPACQVPAISGSTIQISTRAGGCW